MTKTELERKRFGEVVGVVQRLRGLLSDSTPDSEDVRTWLRYLAALKTLQGNSSNDMSFLACLLAKEYLEQQHGPLGLDVAAKAQGAAGLDIDVTTTAGARIVAEVKTMTPYRVREFGGNQRTAFKKDFAKLRTEVATHTYLFVTDPVAYQVLLMHYEADLAGVNLVLLDPDDLAA